MHTRPSQLILSSSPYSRWNLHQHFHSNIQNYGDESDSYGLIYPSIYSNKGVYEEDFFKPRTSNQIKAIFESIGVSMTPEVFQELWKEAARRDPRGQVGKISILYVLHNVCYGVSVCAGECWVIQGYHGRGTSTASPTIHLNFIASSQHTLRDHFYLLLLTHFSSLPLNTLWG